MPNLKLASLILIIFFSSSLVYSNQLASDLSFIREHNPAFKAAISEDLSYDFNQSSELKLTILFMIRTYQNYISSQQNSVCTFTPSCSRFGYYSIRKYGFFYGVLMTSDRFLRCHGFSADYYPYSSAAGKLDDPVDQYYMGHIKHEN
ncbi:MAG: membrane protein insertion efficiency factor YidD [Candidatus Cloacimonetes bacterium]|nr:membrane protein insertion efficiency factor YidD [Candidatus Cloacimonadota bacterium]